MLLLPHFLIFSPITLTVYVNMLFPLKYAWDKKFNLQGARCGQKCPLIGKKTIFLPVAGTLKVEFRIPYMLKWE